jgi:hypothetical protein
VILNLIQTPIPDRIPTPNLILIPILIPIPVWELSLILNQIPVLIQIPIPGHHPAPDPEHLHYPDFGPDLGAKLLKYEWDVNLG